MSDLRQFSLAPLARHSAVLKRVYGSADKTMARIKTHEWLVKFSFTRLQRLTAYIVHTLRKSGNLSHWKLLPTQKLFVQSEAFKCAFYTPSFKESNNYSRDTGVIAELKILLPNVSTGACTGCDRMETKSRLQSLCCIFSKNGLDYLGKNASQHDRKPL